MSRSGNAAAKLRVIQSNSTDEHGLRARPSLISPAVDVLMIGGGSILLLALMSVMLGRQSPDGNLAWFVFSLSFAVNFPHFLASYQLLYVDFGDRILKDAKFFWAGVFAPAIILTILLTGFLSGTPSLLGYLATSMYFFVGWHYVKQIFGGITVSNAMTGFFYNNTERFALKANLFSLWAISFLIPNIGEHNYIQDGIPYASYNLPAWPLSVAYTALVVSGVAVVFVNIKKYIREGRTPSATAVICFLSIYAWYLPAMSHPMFAHTIPFFHSLQYLLFVYVFRRNKVAAQIDQPQTPAGRQKRLIGLYGYLCVPFFTGAIFMYILPRYIDSLQVHDQVLFGPTAAYFAFTLFINIHHYFIDNVIWRGNNDQMRQYLFARK